MAGCWLSGQDEGSVASGSVFGEADAGREDEIPQEDSSQRRRTRGVERRLCRTSVMHIWCHHVLCYLGVASRRQHVVLDILLKFTDLTHTTIGTGELGIPSALL